MRRKYYYYYYYFDFSGMKTMRKEFDFTAKATIQNMRKVFAILQGKLFRGWTIIGISCPFTQLTGLPWMNFTMPHFMEK
ncbi:hypothetical protein Phum_PHUM620970 [Pediculus humanus corporis]|uniref:Uncharacterized protein n=1 Tax=Pediculus humanus subsp. corporis TaxID=121224 RepID=E0W4I4_PEDHC|nr:uncharacterized protein Phum_PHUM620970 [Pediculus humanus corporis]EEB20540.1 hypothetical protein Phum_PHUM620970 [Pediculus humanus corporis]